MQKGLRRHFTNGLLLKRQIRADGQTIPVLGERFQIHPNHIPGVLEDFLFCCAVYT